jgi:hypothetical protein
MQSRVVSSQDKNSLKSILVSSFLPDAKMHRLGGGTQASQGVSLTFYHQADAFV